MRVWTITELLTSRALFVEGRAMRHCVATYAEALRPPSDLDLVDAGGEPAGTAPGLDHRGRPAEADGLPGPEEVQPAAPGGRTGTHGAVGAQEGLQVAEAVPGRERGGRYGPWFRTIPSTDLLQELLQDCYKNCYKKLRRKSLLFFNLKSGRWDSNPRRPAWETAHIAGFRKDETQFTP